MSVLSVGLRGNRAGFHCFRWGFHVKIRRGGWFGHFTVKFTREHDHGRRGARRALWIGWWTSRDGTRGPISGLKFSFTVVRHLQPTPRMRVPIYPTKPRTRERARAE